MQPTTSSGTDLARYLPRYVLTAPPRDAPGRSDFDGVALMLDIAGFTELTETYALQGAAGAERLSKILDAYFGRMTEIALAHGGDVLDFVGDAVLVAWHDGAQPSQTLRLAVQCGLALQSALAAIVAQSGVRLKQRVSLASGRLAYFTVGGVGGKWHSLCTGAALSEAAAANRFCGANETVASPSAWELVAALSDAHPLAGGLAAIQRIRDPLPLPPLPAPASPGATLERFLSQSLLERLRVGDGRWLGEFRNVTTLFTGMPAMDFEREDGLDTLQTIVECAQKVHRRLGGFLEGLSADDKGVKLLSMFGLPLTAREDDGARAVAVALAIAAEMRERSIAVNMGMASSLVFCADRGGAHRRHVGLTGKALNLASRLMVAAPARILCDEATRKSASADFAFEEREPVLAKGFSTPVAVWQPLARAERQRRVFLGTSVGRGAELEQLCRAIDALPSGHAGTMTLRAEPGMGKSRLLSDAAAHARERGIRIASGSGLALEMTSVYFPWRQILGEILCGESVLDIQRACETATRLVAGDETLTFWLPLLNDVLPLQLAESEVTRDMVGQARAEGLRRLVVALASRSARAIPLSIVADDLHWFDGASAALLRDLASAHSPGLLVLAGTRPLDDSAAAELHDFVRGSDCVDLDSLKHGDLRELVADRLDVADVSPALVDLVARRSAGNPLYAEEVVLSLRASGHTEQVDGVVGLSTGSDDEALSRLPPGLRGVIVSRIDSLGASEQVALKVAAVAGPEFSRALLEHLLLETEVAVDLATLMQALQNENVIFPARPDASQYRFKHALLQDTIYEQLPFALRQQLHRLLAEWIERSEANSLEPRYAALALHWERAGDFPTAVSYLEKSAAHSLRHYANREAITQAKRALVLAETLKLPPDAGLETRCEAILGEAHNELFEYRTAKRHYKRALAKAGRPVPRHAATMILDVVRQLAVQVAVHSGLPRRLSVDPSLPLASHIHEKLAEIAYFNSGMLPLLHATLTSLNLAERSGTVREAVSGSAAMAVGFYGAGLHRLSRLYNRRSLALAEAQGGIHDVAYAHIVSGVYWAAQGKWERAAASLEHSASLYSRLGAIERCQQAYAGLCAIELMRGRFEPARAWLDKLRPGGRGAPAQIAAYLHGFETCLELACDGPLDALARHLREVAGAPELAQFDRMFCQGLLAAACWRQGECDRAVAAARTGFRYLASGAPAAWYGTDGIAGIAQTLVDASKPERGLASLKEARQACRVLDRYARAVRVATPRAHLVGGRLAIALGNVRLARRRWRSGLDAARELGATYDEALLLLELATHGSPDDPDTTQLLAKAQEQLQRIGAQPRQTPTLA